MKPSRQLPFNIDLHSRRGLTDQLYEGISNAINNGELMEGDILPTWKEIVKAYGVSQRIPRDAMRRLIREGYVVSRKGLGTVVASSHDRRDWKGVVLFVTSQPDALSYSQVALTNALAQELSISGYRLVTIPMREIRPRVYDYTALMAAMEYRHDFAIVAFNKTAVYRRFSEFNVPFLVTGRAANFPHCCGSVANDGMDCAIADMVDHCRHCGIKRVLQVGFCTPPAMDAAPALEAAGITVNRWSIPPVEGRARMEGIREAARVAFLQRFGKSDGKFPDLIIFADDYVAAGGLFALTELRVKIPQDVRVVTFANEGNLPLSTIQLACVMNRPSLVAHNLAQRVISELAKYPRKIGTEPTCVYQRGASFPGL